MMGRASSLSMIVETPLTWPPGATSASASTVVAVAAGVSGTTVAAVAKLPVIFKVVKVAIPVKMTPTERSIQAKDQKRCFINNELSIQYSKFCLYLANLGKKAWTKGNFCVIL